VDEDGALYDWGTSYWTPVSLSETSWIAPVDKPYALTDIADAVLGITTTTTLPDIFTIKFNGVLSTDTARDYREKRILRYYNHLKTTMTGNLQAVVGVITGGDSNYKKPVSATTFTDATASVSPSITFVAENVGGVGETVITAITPSAETAGNNRVIIKA